MCVCVCVCVCVSVSKEYINFSKITKFTYIQYRLYLFPF